MQFTTGYNLVSEVAVQMSLVSTRNLWFAIVLEANISADPDPVSI